MRKETQPVSQAESVLSELEEMDIFSRIQTQRTHDKISRDETLMEKIDLLVGVLKSDTLESVGINVIRKKLEQLVNRL